MKANPLQAVLDRAAAGKAEALKPPAPAANIGPARATKMIGGHFAPAVATQLRILAAEEGATVQAMIAEALDDLFVKKGKARIAAL